MFSLFIVLEISFVENTSVIGFEKDKLSFSFQISNALRETISQFIFGILLFSMTLGDKKSHLNNSPSFFLTVVSLSTIT